MSRRVIAATAASVVLALGAAACGSGVQERSAPTTTAAPTPPTSAGQIPADSAGICDALARIAAADRASTQQSQDLTDWDDLQPVIVANAAEAVALYDQAMAIAPEEIFDDLLLVRDVTDEAGGIAAEATTAEEFQEQGQQIEDFGDAQAAVERINTFTQRTCGFAFADN